VIDEEDGMSYPKELFHGDKGEVSGRLWQGSSAPDLAIGGRTNVYYLATGESTGGQYGLLFAPGAPREAYFEELAQIAADGRQLSKEEWTDLYRRHDQYMM
jgi:hypothetical protein